ncbi:adenylyl-sulfate kinase [Oleiharenicola lentus]|uniref:adenylyl-sulfate kinase n=1 Tax=Oleiharenicola lentus TaxID=2508720 RepID=UPI003F68193B
MQTKTTGHVFWLFGLSGSGKSTLAEHLTTQLRAKSGTPLILDGDALRAGLCRGLGFSDAERSENLRRAAEVAKLGASAGLPVVASFITPLEAHRQLVAEIIGAAHLSLIHLTASLTVCQSRDVKGLYSRAQKGLVTQMTGITSNFELPSHVDLQIDTATESIEASASKLGAFALSRLSPLN